MAGRLLGKHQYLGLLRSISRQSRSPRCRPMMDISAEARLVAMGTLCLSQTRMVSIIWASSQGSVVLGSVNSSTRGNAGVDLLVAALLMGKQQRDGQTRIVRDQTAGGGCGKEIVLDEHAFIGSAELNHQFLFLVVCQKCNIHNAHSFNILSESYRNDMDSGSPWILFAMRLQALAAAQRGL